MRFRRVGVRVCCVTLAVLAIVSGEPRPVATLEGLGRVRQIIVESGIAYITSREDGLFIVDVSDSAKPKLIGRHDTIEFATGICKSGDVLFAACRTFPTRHFSWRRGRRVLVSVRSRSGQ